MEPIIKFFFWGMFWVRFMELFLVFSNLYTATYTYLYKEHPIFWHVLELPPRQLTYAPPNSGLEDSFVLGWTVLGLYMFVGALVCLGFPPCMGLSKHVQSKHEEHNYINTKFNGENADQQ